MDSVPCWAERQPLDPRVHSRWPPPSCPCGWGEVLAWSSPSQRRGRWLRTQCSWWWPGVSWCPGHMPPTTTKMIQQFNKQQTRSHLLYQKVQYFINAIDSRLLVQLTHLFEVALSMLNTCITTQNDMGGNNLYVPHRGQGRPCRWILGSCWSVEAGSGPPSSHPVTNKQISVRGVTLQKQWQTGNSLNRLITHPED